MSVLEALPEVKVPRCFGDWSACGIDQACQFAKACYKEEDDRILRAINFRDEQEAGREIADMWFHSRRGD